MFVEMCNRLLTLQGDDGLWRTSLLDPKSYPMGETSSSTFYCYAFAWGINNNLLSPQKFKPATEKSWKALCDCVNKETGRLEFVQLPADSPRSPVYKRVNVEYATGAFLLAGSEMLKILQ
jgi:rhamnogalacturonyl hydrolase YesR